jgi:hypothetical protein
LGGRGFFQKMKNGSQSMCFCFAAEFGTRKFSGILKYNMWRKDKIGKKTVNGFCFYGKMWYIK